MSIVGQMRHASFALKEAPTAGRRAVMSSSKVDRVGDIIDQAGWDLADFNANPIMLHEHDRTRPVGVWKDVRVESNELSGVPVWMPADINPAADMLRKMYEDGWLKGFSVGFIVEDAEPIPGGKGGWIIKKAKLLECSAVALPANTDALMKAAPGARILPIDGKPKSDPWSAVNRDAVCKWVAPATDVRVESKAMTLTDEIQAAIKAAVADAMKTNQPDAQTPPKAGDDGAAEDTDDDLLAVALAEAELADDEALIAEIEHDSRD